MKKNYSSSSRFAYNKDLLDERALKRNLSYENAFKDIKISMENILDKYVYSDIITRESLNEWLIQELIKDFRNIS